MARKGKNFVSPGVFLNEIDASFLGPGVGAIGASLIGTAPKGPAQVPVKVTTFSEFTEFFGDLDEDHMLTYAARAYLKNAGSANIVRVLGPTGRTVNGSSVSAGFTSEGMWGVVGLTGSTAVLHATIDITSSADLVVTDLVNDECYVEISGADDDLYDPLIAVTASFNTGSNNYIKKVLNTDPTKYSTVGYYVKDVFDYAYKTHVGGNAIYASSSYGSLAFTFGFNSGSTPWIKSQAFAGVEYNLFRVHTLGHGDAENGRFKLSVKNIRPSANSSVTEFGKFDLELRNFVDTDKSRSVVAVFSNLSLDPKDNNYILRVVGTKYWQYDQTNTKMVEYGNFDNNSKLIRIEMTTGSLPDAVLPWGFRGFDSPDLAFSGSDLTGSASETNDGIESVAFVDMPYVADLKDKATQAEVPSGLPIYWGVEFELSGSVASRLSMYPTMTGSDTDFSLRYVSGSSNTADPGDGEQGLRYSTSIGAGSQKVPGTTTSHTVLDSTVAKFTVPFAFGFDGFDPKLENPLHNATQLLTVSQLGTQALRESVEIISDPDFIDTNLLVIPGINSSRVVDFAIEKVEDRADLFYIADITGSTPASVISEVRGRGFDTNYAAIYYPNIKVKDEVNGLIVELPSSVAAAGVIAYNDRVGYPWFAPAGLNRAGLGPNVIGFTVTNLVDQLKQSERDDLYDDRINPIARFPNVPQGVVWGQKTLQLEASALDRINVRRLLIKAKKLIASSVKFLVFEPGNATTMTRFNQMVNPILADIQQKQGLEAFKVVMDETTNPPELIDRNILTGKIFLIPTRTAEFISVDFVISPTGASFDE